jgi:Family of unknown function (DUF6065)
MERAWMDATDQRFAYRCLPLNIANAHGWEILRHRRDQHACGTGGQSGDLDGSDRIHDRG